MSELEIGIDSSLDEVPAVGEAVRQLCLVNGVSEGDAALIELALVEAIQNSIEHSYGGRPGGRIDIRFTVDNGLIQAEVSDTGLPADPARLAAPSEAAADTPIDRSALSERGRGLEIIRGVFDDVDFVPSPVGNRLALRRRRREQA